MSRMRPEWYLRRQLAQAEARNTFFQNYQGPAETAAIQQRGATTSLYYRSLLLRDGVDPELFTVNVLDTTLASFPATDAGLLAAVPAGAVPQRVRGSGLQPTRAFWYRGDGTPTRRTSRWGTRYTAYHASGSHRSIPFSQGTGVFDGPDLVARFNTLFGPGGTRRALLGSGGRAHLEFEEISISQLT